MVARRKYRSSFLGSRTVTTVLPDRLKRDLDVLRPDAGNGCALRADRARVDPPRGGRAAAESWVTQ
jgi:hypothetical protein